MSLTEGGRKSIAIRHSGMSPQIVCDRIPWCVETARHAVRGLPEEVLSGRKRNGRI